MPTCFLVLCPASITFHEWLWCTYHCNFKCKYTLTLPPWWMCEHALVAVVYTCDHAPHTTAGQGVMHVYWQARAFSMTNGNCEEFGREAWVFGGVAPPPSPPPSRLNPAHTPLVDESWSCNTVLHRFLASHDQTTATVSPQLFFSLQFFKWQFSSLKIAYTCTHTDMLSLFPLAMDNHATNTDSANARKLKASFKQVDGAL